MWIAVNEDLSWHGTPRDNLASVHSDIDDSVNRQILSLYSVRILWLSNSEVETVREWGIAEIVRRRQQRKASSISMTHVSDVLGL